MYRSLMLACLGISCLAAADFDILVRNARVVDGTGNPWFIADVGVREGRVAAMGRLDGKTADRVIDASRRVIAPGFIDVHTHIEGVVERLPRADNYLLDGVTTLVTGNCGSSEVALGPWLAKLDKVGLGPNVGTLVGHNAVRRTVMGRANRLATAAELSKMQALVDQAMRNGALGFSTGLIYIPGTYSDTAEVVALAKAAGKHGGVYASHMRDEGSKVLEAIEEAVTAGREAGVPVQLSHFKIDNKRIWGSSTKSLDLVERFRREGVDVVVDQYPYNRSSTDLSMVVPKWALADGQPAILKRLADKLTRARIVSEMERDNTALGHEDYSYATIANFEGNPSLNGMTISEVTARKKRPAGMRGDIETVLELLQRGGAQMVYHSMGDEDVERIMGYPNTAFASDGGIREFGAGRPHPRAYGTNARVLALYVREKKVLTLEDAIRRMTSLPARTFGLHDRGVLRPGAAADLVLFDPARVQDKATFADPHHYSEGFDIVMVNGKIAVEDGRPTDVRAGKAIRRAQ
jgi:N-acyl-D-amino-acid deacylase